MTTPGDESRTELAWREIVEHYGERAVLPDDDPQPTASARPEAGDGVEPGDAPARPDALPDHLVDDDEVEVRERAAATYEAAHEQFRPPPPPPLPRPSTWQRGLAWAGLVLAPVLGLVIGLFSIYVPALVGWVLFGWFVAGFGYLVREMPRSPRDPYDDGSRV